jgi:hypothetical protein
VERALRFRRRGVSPQIQHMTSELHESGSRGGKAGAFRLGKGVHNLAIDN